MSRAFQSSLFKIIPRRASYRSYREAPEQGLRLAALGEALAELPPLPFGTPVRIGLIAGFDPQVHGVEKLGTYGVIRGAKNFLVGLMPEGPRCFEDLGYAFEWAILTATDLGLQTCWLGGTLQREAFARAAGARPQEGVPVVSPVGIAADKRSLIDHAFRFLARSKDRKAWQELFLARDFQTPLPQRGDSPFARALEMVRLGPSASNKQPWRVLRDPEREVFHFFLARTPGYRKLLQVDLQRIDLGIALCHFTLACQEQGITGRWTSAPPSGLPPPQGLEYIATFESAD